MKSRITRVQGILIMLTMISISLIIGIIGFKLTAGFDSIDAFLNASMLLTGMGPVDEPETASGKLFAGIYALYSGIVFLSSVAIFIYPVLEHAGKHFTHSGEGKKLEDCE